MKKILFIAAHRKDRAPNQRFRFEQYFDFLEQNGFKCELSYLLNEADDKLIYSRGNYFAKAGLILKNIRHRMNDLKKINDFDIIFIVREALMIRSTYFERQFRKSKAKIVYDFDDAIWINDTSDANKFFSWLKNPTKIKEIIKDSDLVFAGNDYLKQFALQFNRNVIIVPTTIDTDEYKPVQPHRESSVVTIGWSGSLTTIKHFKYALPFLSKLKKEYGNRINIKVIGDSSFRNGELNIQGIAWSKKNELSDLSEIDIGIMPLPDDDWAKGKCGLKGLQYMALAIPTIMSPVGVNSQIIQDGENGFLAGTTDEWISKIKMLIEQPELRSKMGNAARETVIKHYSVEANKLLYLESFKNLCR